MFHNHAITLFFPPYLCKFVIGSCLRVLARSAPTPSARLRLARSSLLPTGTITVRASAPLKTELIAFSLHDLQTHGLWHLHRAPQSKPPMASVTVADPSPGEDAPADETPDRELSLKESLLRKAESSHGKMPGIRRVPLPAIGIIFFIALVNVIVWVGVAIVLVHPSSPLR
jgi:hypothetical protein